MITFGSVCSGIEAASVAWNPIGLRAAWLAEVDKFPSAVLEYHYPDTENLGDMTQIAERVLSGEVDAPDILVGGTPCQAFSVAGVRGGLSDERGALTIKYVELADAIDNIRHHRGEQPAVIVWENVPGVLSSKDNAFGCFLGALAGEDCELEPPGRRWENAGCVYGPKRAIAWRVLDAQYFGLAQRRKRVFLVASARDRFDPAKVLFEFDGVRRETAPSREAGEETTGGSEASLKTASHGGGLVAHGFRMVAFGEYADDDTASTMKARDYKDATDLVCSVHGTQDPIVGENLAHTLGRNGGQENAVSALSGNIIGRQPHTGGNGTGYDGSGVCYTMTTADRHGVAAGTTVRRLTPIECERLQGFPDNWTQIPWNGKPAEDCPDGHRYKALGNSMAVPVMRWIGERIISNL